MGALPKSVKLKPPESQGVSAWESGRNNLSKGHVTFDAYACAQITFIVLPENSGYFDGTFKLFLLFFLSVYTEKKNARLAEVRHAGIAEVR